MPERYAVLDTDGSAVSPNLLGLFVSVYARSEPNGHILESPTGSVSKATDA